MSSPNDALLVRRQWLEKADAKLFKDQPAEVPAGAGNLFYDVRPAILKSAWSQNAAGLYAATAAFIVNNAVDNSFIFDVAAPTATANPGGEVGTTRFFVVWRGRWETLDATPPAQQITYYGSGEGIYVVPTGSNRAIENTGAYGIHIMTGESAGAIDSGHLYFDGRFFKKRSNQGLPAGKAMFSLKVVRKYVVTNGYIKPDGTLELTREMVNCLENYN